VTATPPALVLEHEADAPAGILAEWAAERGIALEVFAWHAAAADADADAASPSSAGPDPDPSGRPFVVVLGSEASAFDDTVPWLARERAVIDRALALGVPILGICFGGQHLARALGGTVARASRPEVGWLEVESSDPAAIPPGRYLQWHRDAFTLPPDAKLLARSPVSAQAFRSGPHLGVQFHPEVTPAIAMGWATNYPESVAHAATTVAEIQTQGDTHATDAHLRAFALFDAFLAGTAG
jgi:GMP synthase (glutamine-hydrolysing)